MTPVDIAVTVAAKLLEYMVGPIIRPFGYIVHHSKNIEGLRSQVSSLEHTQFGVQHRVEVADRKGEIILPNVKEWLARANGLATESQSLLNSEADRNHSCLNGSCPNLKLIYQTSRKAKKNAVAVDELVRDGKFDLVSHPAPRPPLWPISSIATTSGDLEVFESRKAQLESIMEALRDDNVSIIGVYGMGGIGKTTFVEEAAKQADAHKLFDETVMVMISQKPNLRKIQGDLAEMLDLDLKQESEILRTARLRERLNQVKRILVILDDIWAPLDLEAIGILRGTLHKGCKIILASRSLDVCNAMNTQRNFYIDVLSEMESWSLFRKMAGDRVDSSDLHPIAIKVAKRCSGLPLAIVTVARALRHRSKHAWRDALRQLRSSTSKDVKGLYANVFLSLELSFNFLKDEEAKSCFLLCSLFREDLDVPLEYLVRYGMGLRVFQNVHTLEEARDRVHTLIENLKACCLLLDGEGEECFRLHDVTRDFLLSVASRARYIFLENTMPRYLESPNSKLSNSYAISMLSNDLEELPIDLDCPKLQLWRLEGSLGLMQTPGNFCEGMKELKVVIMHHVSIPSMPPSLLALRKLLTLCLEHCKIGDLSLIKELKHLEILSFVSSDLEKLPMEVGELSHLKLLDLTDCKNLTVIPFGVFSKLSNLECLYMMNSFVDWGLGGQNTSQSRATLSELKHLSHLNTLEMHIPDVSLFPKDLIFGNLVRFKVFIGMDVSQVINYSYPKTLRLAIYQGVNLHNGIYTLLKGAQHLILDYSIVNYLEDLHSIFYDFRKGIGHFRCLEVYGYTGVESLIDTNIFPVLEKLKVVSAADLKMICHDHLPPQSFSELQELMLSILPELTHLWKDSNRNVCLRNLRTLHVSDCHKLKDLLSQSTARDMSQLQKLHVSSCEVLMVILSKDKGVAVNDIELSSLKSLSLEFLPSLQCFCPESDAFDSVSLDARTQEPLFNKKVDFPALEELTLREVHYVKQIWQQPLPATNFCTLRILIVYRCDNLVMIIPSDLGKRLQNLEILSVEWCDSVEEVCELKELPAENVHDTTSASLPYVRDLILGKLPRLKRLWWNIDPHAYISLRNLNSLQIYECDCLNHLFSISAMKGLEQLEELKIHSCKMMTRIFANEDNEEVSVQIVLPELCSIVLEDLPELSTFSQGNHFIDFPSLATVEIRGCPKLKTFVASDAHEEGNNIIMQPLFNEKVALPDLQELCLVGMNSLVEIWHNQLPEKTFSKLRVLEVMNCDQLLHVGQTSMLPRLQMLEKLHIMDCGSLEEVFAPEESQIQQDVASIPLINLVELVLDNLPKLRNIWWDKDSNKIHRFQSLSSMEVSSCHLLDYVFPPSVARGLVHLQKLRVDSCQSIKEIVGKHGGESEPNDVKMLPQIYMIELENLQNLVSFCAGTSALRWLSLKELRIVNCSKMVSFLSISSIKPSQPFFNGKVVFPSLEKLRIDSLQSSNELWQVDFTDESFCQLRVVEVRNCNNLLSLIPLSLLPRLQNLEELSVNQCCSLQKIVEQEQENTGSKFVLPKLHTLRFTSLPQLETFHLGKHSFEFPNLERVTFEDCPKSASILFNATSYP